MSAHHSTMSTTGQVIKCKAAVAWVPGKPLSIEDVEVAPPKAHEVRIKVVAAGLSHTDWEYLNQTGSGTKLRRFPLVLGREAAGIVESVGPEVTDFSPGDNVIPLFLPHCGDCVQCRGPKRNQCRKNWANAQVGVLADGTSRISIGGQQVYQYLGVSSFCQYTVVTDICLAKLRSNAPLDEVCLLGWDVATGYGAAANVCKVEKDSLCAVFGLGTVGLAAVMGCRADGAKRIIAVDSNADKFEKARMLGATDCVVSTEPIGQLLVTMTDGGVDYALECDGRPDVMGAALESTTDGWGTCVIVGETETEAMSVTVEKILMGRTLKGTYFGDWRSVEEVPRLVDDYMNTLKLGEFVGRSLQLDQINTAFESMKSEDSVHTVIHLWEETPGCCTK